MYIIYIYYECYIEILCVYIYMIYVNTSTMTQPWLSDSTWSFRRPNTRSQQVPADSWPCEHESSLDGEGNHFFLDKLFRVKKTTHVPWTTKSKRDDHYPKVTISCLLSQVRFEWLQWQRWTHLFFHGFHVLQMRLENGSGLGRSVDAKFTKGDQGYGRWGPRSRWRMRWVEIWLCLN